MNIKALSLAVAMAAFAPIAAQADTVTFIGEITASTCVPTGGAGGDYTAPFGILDSGAFSAINDEAGMTSFDVTFQDCPTTGTKIGVHFQGATADMATGYLNNGTTGTAQGVAIKIYNGSSEHVHLGQALPATSFVTPDTTTGAVTLPHHATLVRTGAITDGTINAVATIVVHHQ